jgi:serine/threonine protein kinase
MSSTQTNPPDPALAALTDELRAALAPGIQLLHPLGAGGMGYVFLGRDPLLKRQVAIKVLTPDLANDDTARARFVREAESSAAVGHPNVVGIHMVGELPHSRTPYFVMQFIEGRTLGDDLESGSGMTESRARRIIGEVAAALAAAHARGLVHRDIKPANIMVEAESDRAVVLDFGISAILAKGAGATQGAKLTQTGTYLGTPTYMSPEQATGEEVKEKSDVYSLGCVAFEMLTGKPPFQGQTLMVMAAHVKDQPMPMSSARPGVDAHLAQVVDRCLAKDPAARPTAAEVAQSLLPQTQPLIEWPPPGLEPLRGAGTRLAVPWTMLAAAILLLFVVLANQPTMASPQWTQGENSALWSNLVSISGPGTSARERQTGLATQDASPVWLFLIGATWVALFGLVIVVGIRTERFLFRALAATRTGYPWQVVKDVAWDDTREIGGLLNVSGPYALMTAANRLELLRLLRHRALVAPTVLAGTVLLSLMWTLGLLGGDPTGALVSLRDLLVVATPTIFGVADSLWIAKRIRALGGVRRHWFRREKLVLPDASVVGSWLAAAGMSYASKAGRRAPSLRWAARLGGSAALLAALFAAFLLSWAAFIPAAKMSQAKVDAQRWMDLFKSDSTRPMRWAEFDSTLARSAVPQVATMDLAAGLLLQGRGLLRFRRYPGDNFDILVTDTAGARRLNEPADTVDVRRGLLDLFGGTEPSAENLRLMTVAAGSSWLPVWRRFARSASYPALWQFRAGLQGADAFPELPFVSGGPLVAQKNLAAAHVALRRGNAAEAELRVRENFGAARQFMRNGVYLDFFVGRRIVQEGADFLRVIAKRTGDARLNTEATALQAIVQRWQSEQPRSLTWTSLFADPVNPKMLEYMNGDWSAVQYSQAMNAAGTGVCTNAREILFGPHPARFEVHRRIAKAWGDPRATELADLADRSIRKTFDGQLLEEASVVLKPLEWVGLAPLAMRLVGCSIWTG